MFSTVTIPNKSTFKLEEVCTITNVKSYVLRFWESEFDEICPIISSSGQKLYEHKDIETILLLKKLLLDEKLSVEEAKIRLKNPTVAIEEPPCVPVAEPAPVLAIKAFSDEKMEKLKIAREKLGNLLSFTESLKEIHHWN